MLPRPQSGVRLGPGLPVQSALRVLIERKSPDHNLIAEFFPQAIDGMLGFGGPPIDKVSAVGFLGFAQSRYADSDQPESGTVDLSNEEIPPRGKDFRGQLRRLRKGPRTRPDPEIRGLELERDR